MTAISDWITELEGNQFTDYTQPLQSTVGAAVRALQQISSGLTPAGPEAANTFYAGPVAGAPALPAFRPIDPADLAAITTYTAGDILFASATGGITTSNGLAWNAAVGSIVINSQAIASPPAPQVTTALQIVGNNTASRAIEFTALASVGQIGFYRYNGTFAVPTGVLNGNPIGVLFGNGWGATQLAATNPALISMVASENWTDTARGCQIQFSTTLIGSLIRSGVFSILDTGATVTIGSASAASFIPTGTVMPNTGIYLQSAGVLSFAAGGTQRFTIGTNFAGAGAARSPLIKSGGATAANPTLVPDQSSSNTGIGSQAAGNVCVTLSAAEAVRFVSVAVTQQIGPFTTVGALPAAGARGARTFVTDALAPVFASAVAGGGAIVCPVYDDGATWRCG